MLFKTVTKTILIPLDVFGSEQFSKDNTIHIY